jgi:hypothetical protein
MGWRRRVDEGEQEGQEWRAGRAFATSEGITWSKLLERGTARENLT